MNNNIPLNTYTLQINGEHIMWPDEISDDVYTLIYTHSKLLLNENLLPLPYATLYEAWAFNGKKSWHIWNRNNEWVCTEYDSEKDDPTLFIHREQILLEHIARTVNKSKLIIHERIAYDEDNQAYIAYSCPINLSN